jgi:hypothetical protein
VVPILSQMHPVHAFPLISLRSILILPSHIRLGFPNGYFPSSFSTKILYTFLASPIRATCTAHPSLLDLMSLIIVGKEPR